MRLPRFHRARPGNAVVVSDDDVLEAAVRVFVASPEASLADVGRHARVELREMRARFGTREAVIDRVIMRGARRIARGAVLEDGTPAEQIALLVARLWDDQEPVAPFITLGVRAHLRVPVEETLAPARALFADAVARGAHDGTLRADVSPRAVAWLIEQSVLDCLEALARGLMEDEDGRTFVMRQALATAGLGWTDAAAVTDAVTRRIS
ncbi:hypothetical protein [Demequina muriae]|uniref:Transcriptional regulator, TetR family n=1 Tax=Demequina muriae TaxID=3051664 RepID=A0ABT8GDA8_9MICO|nr:hypothetical protein [Demequina sp. EGI L300058]MDN4479412.1 hypothetical protein [Demequina sp. EGI L300058]